MRANGINYSDFLRKSFMVHSEDEIKESDLNIVAEVRDYPFTLFHMMNQYVRIMLRRLICAIIAWMLSDRPLEGEQFQPGERRL